MKSKRKKNEQGFTLIELIMVIVILGIISAVAIPKFLNLSDSAKLSSARGIGGAIGGSIQAAHSDFLINGTTYGLASVLSATAFNSGVTYQSTATDDPAPGEICSNAAGTEIVMDYKNSTFHWTWTAPAGDTPALLTETAGNFPTP